MIYRILDNLTLFEKELNEQEFNILMSCVNELTFLSNEIDYYRIVKQNITDFLSLQDVVQIESYDNFVLLNSKMANWLNSYYMWKSFHNNTFKSAFGELQNELREKSAIYKLADVLRNCVVHESFVISTITYDCLKERAFYCINPIDVIHSSCNNAISREWLNNKNCNNEMIDAISYTKDFSKIFEEIQQDIWKILRPSFIRNMNECFQIVDFEYSDIRNLIVYIKNDEITKDRRMFGRCIYQLKQKIRDNVPEQIINISEQCGI